jgi:hypothetical protein
MAGQSRSQTETCQPSVAGHHIHQQVGRLDVLVDETPFVEVTNCCGNPDGQTQEPRNGQWVPDQSIQKLSSGILNQEPCLATELHQIQGASRPRGIQFIPQGAGMSEECGVGRKRRIRRRNQQQHPQPVSFPSTP